MATDSTTQFFQNDKEFINKVSFADTKAETATKTKKGPIPHEGEKAAKEETPDDKKLQKGLAELGKLMMQGYQEPPAKGPAVVGAARQAVPIPFGRSQQPIAPGIGAILSQLIRGM